MRITVFEMVFEGVVGLFSFYKAARLNYVAHELCITSALNERCTYIILL